MATTAKKKTTTTKKTTTRPKTAAAKTTKRKAPVKRTAAKTTVRSNAAARNRQKSTFLTMTPTVETAYWVILGAVVVLLAIWVLNLTAKINNIYDQIDVQNASNSVIQPQDQKHAATKPDTKAQ